MVWKNRWHDNCTKCNIDSKVILTTKTNRVKKIDCMHMLSVPRGGRNVSLKDPWLKYYIWEHAKVKNKTSQIIPIEKVTTGTNVQVFLWSYSHVPLMISLVLRKPPLYVGVRSRAWILTFPFIFYCVLLAPCWSISFS